MTLHSRSRLQTSIASVLLVLDKILDCCIDVQPLLPILIISDVVVHFETLLVEEEAFLLLWVFFVKWLGIKNLIASDSIILDERPDEFFPIHTALAEMAYSALVVALSLA